jgi:hypothetical protein
VKLEREQIRAVHCESKIQNNSPKRNIFEGILTVNQASLTAT